MKALIIFCMAFFAIIVNVNAQDTTSVPTQQGDPSLKQSAKQLQDNMLKDMVKIDAKNLPAGVKKAVESDQYKGAKTYFKHKEKKEYVMEVRDGEVSSFHFYDKAGNVLNKKD